jgi:hypothetical protein
LNLTLANFVDPQLPPGSVYPSCFPDVNGQVFLRGHLTVTPVPAVGGILLALFPKDTKGDCACTPVPDPGTQSNNVIATTTAVSFPLNQAPDVCIVRLLIGVFLPMDVNSDHVIDGADVTLVNTSPYFSNNETVPAEMQCPYSPKLQRIDCGPADVNLDGRVSSLDSLSITNSAGLNISSTPLHIPCGGVYATAFSCGSTRKAPLTPAVEVSFDSIVYFNNDGVFGAELPARRSVDRSLTHNILFEFEHFQDKVESQFHAMDSQFHAIDSKFDSKFLSHEKKIEKYDRVLQTVPVSKREVLVAVASIALCGVIAYFIAKKR